MNEQILHLLFYKNGGLSKCDNKEKTELDITKLPPFLVGVKGDICLIRVRHALNCLNKGI